MTRVGALGWTLVLVVSSLAVATAHAERLRGGVASSGGHTSNGSGYALRGTVGQAAVGGSSGTNFFVCHGYWCFGGSRVVSVTFDPGDPRSGAGLPTHLELSPPSPNPSRGSVRFALALPRDADVTFAVLDVAGRQIGEVVRQRLVAGRHDLQWTAPSLSAGVYFGELVAEGERPIRKRIVLVK